MGSIRDVHGLLRYWVRLRVDFGVNGVFSETPTGLALAADWNALYRESDPWAQGARIGDPRLDAEAAAMARYYHDSRRTTAHALKAIRARGAALEIGCGHGHAINAYRMMGPMLCWSGADISAQALAQAWKNTPSLRFHVIDIAHERLDAEFDVIVLGEMLWYVLERIHYAVMNAHAMLRPGGALVISQGFLRNQRYGTHIANGFDGAAAMMMQRFSRHLRLVRAEFDENGEPLQHGVLVFRKVD